MPINTAYEGEFLRHQMVTVTPRWAVIDDVFAERFVALADHARGIERWYRMGKTYRGKAQNLTQFYHPLDMVGEWNRAYGSASWPIQFVVPTEAVEPFKGIMYDIPEVGPLLVSQCVQAFRAGQPGAAELPDPRLERLR